MEVVTDLKDQNIRGLNQKPKARLFITQKPRKIQKTLIASTTEISNAERAKREKTKPLTLAEEWRLTLWRVATRAAVPNFGCMLESPGRF